MFCGVLTCTFLSRGGIFWDSVRCGFFALISVVCGLGRFRESVMFFTGSICYPVVGRGGALHRVGVYF